MPLLEARERRRWEALERDPGDGTCRRELLTAARREGRLESSVAALRAFYRRRSGALRRGLWEDLRAQGISFGDPDPALQGVAAARLSPEGDALVAVLSGPSLVRATGPELDAYEEVPIEGVRPADLLEFLWVGPGAARVECVYVRQELPGHGEELSCLWDGEGWTLEARQSWRTVALEERWRISADLRGTPRIQAWDTGGSWPTWVDVGELPFPLAPTDLLELSPATGHVVHLSPAPGVGTDFTSRRTVAEVWDLARQERVGALEAMSRRMPRPAWAPDGAHLAWVVSRPPESPALLVAPLDGLRPVARRELPGVPESAASTLAPHPTWIDPGRLLLWDGKGAWAWDFAADLLEPFGRGFEEALPEDPFACAHARGGRQVLRSQGRWSAVERERGRALAMDLLDRARVRELETCPWTGAVLARSEAGLRAWDGDTGRPRRLPRGDPRAPFLDTRAALDAAGWPAPEVAPEALRGELVLHDVDPGRGRVLVVRVRRGAASPGSTEETLECRALPGGAPGWEARIAGGCLRAAWRGGRVLVLREVHAGWVLERLDPDTGALLGPESGLLPRALDGPRGHLRGRAGARLAAHPEDPDLAFVRVGGGLWRVPTGAEEPTCLLEPARPLVLEPEGRTALVVAADRSLERVDLRTGAPLATLFVEHLDLRAVTLTPDARHMVLGVGSALWLRPRPPLEA